jgi:hypothetical protein
MALLPTVPGVYFEPRPRKPEVQLVRTDVVGFIGFESRIRNASDASRILNPAVPQGHRFAIDVTEFNVDVGQSRAKVPAIDNLILSHDAVSIPINDNQSIVYSVNAVQTGSGIARLVIATGTTAVTGRERAPSEADITPLISAVIDGSTPSALTGGPPPTGHSFKVDIAPFEICLGDAHLQVTSVTNFVLSENLTSIPIADGESIVYAVVLAELNSTPQFLAVGGRAAVTGKELPPPDALLRDTVLSTLGNRAWTRIANVRISRTGNSIQLTVDDYAWTRLADIHVKRQSTAINLLIVPTLPPAQLEDWNDYLYTFGTPVEDGTYLAKAVRAYFSNGGRRCYVASIKRPDFEDVTGLAHALTDMIGVKGDNLTEATGLERLLLINDVSVVDAPDLYALRDAPVNKSFELPGTTEQACFEDCATFTAVTLTGEALLASRRREPLYTDPQVLTAQRQMLIRVVDESWRVLLLFSVPVELNPSSGRFEGPGKEKAKQWQQDLSALGEEPHKMSCAALYFPWVLVQEQVGEPVYDMPPTPLVAGVIARRDLARGAYISPANETLRGAVGTTHPISDDINSELYEPPTNINVLRSFPGYGVQLWGARTLSSDKWLRYVAVRRGLSAIERRALDALQPLVFEPHNATLWLQITQMLLGILLPIFESGALRGERPEQAFYIRCDSSVNPPEQMENGILVCEVGVAIAAPAEFIVFRLGRREGAIEVME